MLTHTKKILGRPKDPQGFACDIVLGEQRNDSKEPQLEKWIPSSEMFPTRADTGVSSNYVQSEHEVNNKVRHTSRHEVVP